MSRTVLLLLAVAVVSAFFAFGGMVQAAVGVAKVVLVVAVALAVFTFFLDIFKPKG